MPLSLTVRLLSTEMFLNADSHEATPIGMNPNLKVLPLPTTMTTLAMVNPFLEEHRPLNKL